MPAAYHILLIDDEPFVLELLKEVLSLHGYHVTAVASLDEAKTVILERQIDLIVSDAFLSDGKRTELITDLDYHGIPVIFMTGYQAAPNISARHVLIKPFSVETLLQAVQKELMPDTNLL